MKPYPAYKDSGIEWIGEIPEEWETKKIKYLLISKKGAIKTGPFGSQLKNSDMTSSGIKVYNQRCVLDNDFDSGLDFISENKFLSLKEFEVNPHDLLITTRGTIGKCAIFPKNKEKGVLHPCLMRIQVNKTLILNEYLQTYIQDSNLFQEDVLNNSNATTIEVIYSETLKNISIPFPKSIHEQKKVLSFIHTKTSQIDNLIDKKQKQIELLKEERTAIINQAVTKGLNPDVPMKDSGIEWLGEVPAEWTISKLKYIIKTLISGVSVNSSDEPAEAHEYGVLKTSCVYTGEFNVNENKKIVITEYERATCSIKANTIIISRMNTPELVGASGFVDKDYENIFLPDRLWQTVFFIEAKIVPKWLSYFFASNRFRTVLSSLATGTSSSMKNISQDDLLGSYVCLPPIEEQNMIVQFLDNEKLSFDNLISKSKKQITFLQEYRTALISNAVTGKIDLRDTPTASLQ